MGRTSACPCVRVYVCTCITMSYIYTLEYFSILLSRLSFFSFPMVVSFFLFFFLLSFSFHYIIYTYIHIHTNRTHAHTYTRPQTLSYLLFRVSPFRFSIYLCLFISIYLSLPLLISAIFLLSSVTSIMYVYTNGHKNMYTRIFLYSLVYGRSIT